jgi:predicted cobalt transporter CbtA
VTQWARTMQKAQLEDERGHVGSNRSDEMRGLVGDLFAYVKHQTLSPLTGFFRAILVGVVGSVLVATGFAFLVVGLLRLLQDETGTTFQGHLSWLPYLLTLVAASILVGISIPMVLRAGEAKRASERRKG